MKRELEVMSAIRDAFVIGTKNAASLLITVILYVLTIWIPYLNVGTTIAMNTIPRKLASGEIINPTFIFDSIYRRKMGSYFLLQGFLAMMIIPAILFLIIPALVLSFMYSLSLYIMLDDDTTPTEALERSNKATYGFKWKIFGVKFLFFIVLSVAASIIGYIFGLIGSDFLSGLATVCIIVVAITCAYAIEAVIYRNLYLRPNAQNEEESVAETA